MEYQTLDAISGDRAQPTLIALEYAAADSLTLGGAFGLFNAKDKDDYDVEEADIYLTYNWKEQTNFELVYAQVNDKNRSGNDYQLHAILTYNY